MSLTGHLLTAAGASFFSHLPFLPVVAGSLWPDLSEDWLKLRHRTTTHYPELRLLWIPLIVVAILSQWPYKSWLFGFALGDIFHLIVDAPTPTGLPSAVTGRRIKFPFRGSFLYATGSPGEYIFSAVFLGLAVLSRAMF